MTQIDRLNRQPKANIHQLLFRLRQISINPADDGLVAENAHMGFVISSYHLRLFLRGIA